MNIGALIINAPTVLAPLAGYTHLPFRLLVKEHGCGLVCSEMISAKGLIYGSAKTESSDVVQNCFSTMVNWKQNPDRAAEYYEGVLVLA